jgi:hypothetical protein
MPHKNPVTNIVYFFTQDIRLIFVTEKKCVYCEVGNEVFFTKEQKFSLSNTQRHIGGNSSRVLYTFIYVLIMVNELISRSGRFAPWKDSRYQLTRRLGGPRRRSGLYGKELNLSAGIKIRSPAVPWLRWLVAVFRRGAPVSKAGQSMWDPWWQKWHWGRFHCLYCALFEYWDYQKDKGAKPGTIQTKPSSFCSPEALGRKVPSQCSPGFQCFARNAVGSKSEKWTGQLCGFVKE